jgi:anti-sigma factor RsiW
MRPDPHISDDDLIMAMDGELEEPRRGEVNRHLSHCWECRGRRAQFERAIEDYMVVHRAMAEDLRPSPEAGPTARLRATLASERADEAGVPARWWSGLARMPRALIAGSAAAMLLPLAVFVWISVRSLEASGPLPDARLTPGAVRFISKQQVCGVPPEDEGRMVPADLARRVFEQYRIANPKPRAYEVDYLISPALGGTTAMQNLWPVPYADGVWTSRVKDALEDHLRNLVCEGTLDLATAQQEIASDWIAAYRKHFRTKTPVAAHAFFVKDSPWE